MAAADNRASKSLRPGKEKRASQSTEQVHMKAGLSRTHTVPARASAQRQPHPVHTLPHTTQKANLFLEGAEGEGEGPAKLVSHAATAAPLHQHNPRPPAPSALGAASTPTSPRQNHTPRPLHPCLDAGGEVLRWSIGGAVRQSPPPHSAPLYYRALCSPDVSHEFMRNQCSRAPILAGTTRALCCP